MVTASTADGGEDSRVHELRHHVHKQLFNSNEERLVVVVSATKLKVNKKTKKNKPVLLALSVKKGVSPRLHKIEQQGPYSFSKEKTWKLEDLTRVDGSDGLEVTLHFHNKSTRWRTLSTLDKHKLVWCLLKLCQDCLQTTPLHSAVNLSELNQLAEEQQFAVLFDAASSSIDQGEVKGTRRTGVTISGEEESDIQLVLQTYSADIGDAGALVKNLSDEIATLERKNVTEILDSSSNVLHVVSKLNEASAELNTMDQWLNNYNLRLHAMRKHIEQIEMKNNKMEIQTRNHQRLYDEVSALLERLQFDSVHLRHLRECQLDSAQSLTHTITAARALRDKLAVKAELPVGMFHMRAVNERFHEFEEVRDNLVLRVHKYLSAKFELMATTCMSDRQRFSHRGFLTWQSHADLHNQLEPYAPLMEVLSTMDPDNFSGLTQVYVKQMQALNTKEIREFFAELRHYVAKDPKEIGKLGKRKSSVSDLARRASAVSIRQSTTAASVQPSGSAATSVPESFDLLNNQPVGKWKPIKAFRYVLHVAIPVVHSEMNFCKLFFGPFKAVDSAAPSNLADDPAEQTLLQLMESLYTSLVSEMDSLCAYLSKIEPLTSLRCIVATEKVKAAEKQHGLFLPSLMEGLQGGLFTLYNQWIDGQVESIRESKVPPKNCGVLPPFVQFRIFLGSMEEIIAEQTRPDVVVLAYEKLAQCMFTWLQEVAAQTPKYTTLILLENYHHFYALTGAQEVEGLSRYTEEAELQFGRSMEQYCKWMAQYKMKEFIEFFDGIRAFLRTNGAQANEVQFQEQFNKQSLRKLFKKHTKGLQKGLKETYARIDKHVAPDDRLNRILRQRLTQYLITEYQEWERLVAECYQDDAISPSSEEFAQMVTYLSGGKVRSTSHVG